MSGETLEERLARAEGRIEVLLEQQNPPPKSIWDRIFSLDTLRNLIYLVGFPAALLVAWQEFDKEILSAQAARDLERKNLALERLDQLQEINTEIYRLQSGGADDQAFAIIEGKRGQIARLTDSVYTAWNDQRDMFSRYDLNALAEALLVQKRTDEALEVANLVATEGLGPIDRIDQEILKARILFSEGPAQDLEAARLRLSEAMPIFDDINRWEERQQMDEKILYVRLANEKMLDSDCGMLMALAEALNEVHTANAEIGRDFGTPVGNTLAEVGYKCG
ncbi:hypothetical protein [Amaricoccus tamworthensis]|uniref:hypothetical protein n=1 Tax=Amaricoccus tamworthensis TaxID=57002 RepID=UPI003C7A2A55